MYCSPLKMDLFCTTLQFLGHMISIQGIEPNPEKIDTIKKWPHPKNAMEVRSFLELVWYISVFLPHLVDHTAILTPLTTKDVDQNFPHWEESHQKAFEAIKSLVMLWQCLTVIDHENPGDQTIFVICDASDKGTGAVLSFGCLWEESHPMAFESAQLSSCKHNYPVHERSFLLSLRLYLTGAQTYLACISKFTPITTPSSAS